MLLLLAVVDDDTISSDELGDGVEKSTSMLKNVIGWRLFFSGVSSCERFLNCRCIFSTRELGGFIFLQLNVLIIYKIVRHLRLKSLLRENKFKMNLMFVVILVKFIST